MLSVHSSASLSASVRIVLTLTTALILTACGGGGGGNSGTPAAPPPALAAPDLKDADDQSFTTGTAITALVFTNNGGGSLLADNASPSPGCAASNLPAGLMISRTTDASSCQITGTPTTPTSAAVTITATNATGADASPARVSIEVMPSGLQDIEETQHFVVGTDYQSNLVANPGATATPIEFENVGDTAISACALASDSPALPGGLTVSRSSDETTCAITGTPTAYAPVREYTVVANPRAANTAETSVATVRLRVITGEVPDIAWPYSPIGPASAAALIVLEQNFAYTGANVYRLVNRGSPPQASEGCVVSSGTLPAGLSFEASADGETCVISGTAMDDINALQSLTLKVINGEGESEATVSLRVTNPVAEGTFAVSTGDERILRIFQTSTLYADDPRTFGNQASSNQVRFSGAQVITCRLSDDSPALPQGLTLSPSSRGASCIFTGTPTTATVTNTYTILAHSNDGDTATAEIDIVVRGAADADANGLIEIYSLEMLNHIRFNLAGTSYKTSAGDEGDSSGCPSGTCSGYELTRNLDFDADGDGSTWTADGGGGYTLDTDDNHTSYFPVSAISGTSAGWTPVGDNSSAATRFTATFDGNGYVIANLLVRRNLQDSGFFGVLGAGSVVRNLGLVNALVDSTKTDGASIGILAGWQADGIVAASYATGAVSGGAGDDDIGGLLGNQHSDGTVIASYTTATASGRDGNDNIGGLIGQSSGAVTASYATGGVSGGAGDDRAGGLVGAQAGGASIIASYATGVVDGGAGTDLVGGLVGSQDSGGTITAGYGFGDASGETDNSAATGKPPSGAGTASALTATNAGAQWNQASSNTMGAWNFGSSSQNPALNYADYDGSGSTFSCDMFPDGLCGTLIALLKHGLEAPALTVDSPNQISLSWPAVIGAVRYEVYRHTADDSAGAGNAVAGNVMTLGYTDMGLSADTAYYYWIKACDATKCSDFTPASVAVTTIVDTDNNGLIEIRSLQMLNHIRFNLAGTSYKTSPEVLGATAGCPDEICTGYELMQNLDFDADGDGSTWTADGSGYTLDTGDHNATYFPITDDAASAGWTPVGDNSAPFTATFDGKGYVIANLLVRRNLQDIGLFGVPGAGSVIRNLGLVNALVETTKTDGTSIGILVGWQSNGIIAASYATGVVSGGAGNDWVGSLIGNQHSNGTVIASYATGAVSGGTGDDAVGGLIGGQNGAVTASYATGAVSGGAGDDKAGGLAGEFPGGTVTASYATGVVDGGAGTDLVGGLAGSTSGTITASYGFGTATGETDNSAATGNPPSGAATASALTATNAGAEWNQAASNTMGAWNFGSSSQTPALNYADYDGAGATFSCDIFPAATLCTTPALISFNQRLLAPVLTAGSPSQIMLMWTAVTGATHYQIWRHTSDNSSAATRIVESTTTGTSTYTDSANLSAGTAYYYWLKACDSTRCSDFSPVASATTTAGP